jgi:hypothetical protein
VVPVEDFLQGIQGAGADVAENDTDGGNHHRGKCFTGMLAGQGLGLSWLLGGKAQVAPVFCNAAYARLIVRVWVCDFLT